MSTQAKHPSEHAGGALTIQRVRPFEQGRLVLSSAALDAEGWIDDRYSAWFDNLVPTLAWTGVLEAESYALVVEDPDAPGDKPFVHWLIWNIPGTATALPVLSRHATDPELNGAIQGRNSAGQHGWHGVQPPEGHGVHRYHLQLFALSSTLDHLGREASLEELVDALKGVTIAAAELVGLYERRDPLATRLAHADARGGLDADDSDRHAPHAPDGMVLQRP